MLAEFDAATAKAEARVAHRSALFCVVLRRADVCFCARQVASAQAARVQGASQSFAQAMSTLPTAFVFYIGGVFSACRAFTHPTHTAGSALFNVFIDTLTFRMPVSQGTLTFGQVMQVFLALTLAVVGVTQVSQASGTVGDAGPAGKFLLGLGWGYFLAISHFFICFQFRPAPATALFLLVDRAPAIDAGAEGGLQPDTCPGRLELRNVKFSYPARPAALVLKGLSLACPPGLTTALVGESGSGKSTVIQLLMRRVCLPSIPTFSPYPPYFLGYHLNPGILTPTCHFFTCRMYDPASGSVFLDGADMRQLNPRWLRSHVGLVQQEPALFGGSIAFNVAYGKENATPAEVRFFFFFFLISKFFLVSNLFMIVLFRWPPPSTPPTRAASWHSYPTAPTRWWGSGGSRCRGVRSSASPSHARF